MRQQLFLGLAVIVSITCAAHAEPLVNKGKKPGVITKWETKGSKVMLTVRDGVDPKDVADAINDGVERVRAKVKGGKVQVKGKSEAELLEALSGVDFGEEDFGALAAAESEDDDDSGSSLRAKKSADLAKLFKDSGTTAIARVVSVKQKTFPKAQVKVQILRGPTGKLGKKIRKGKKVVFTPVIKMKGKSPDWSHDKTQVNAGGWFLRKGDKVRIKIGKKNKTGFKAKVIDRS